MKKKLTIAAALFMILCVPAFSLVLDLRTKFEEKIELAPIKSGALYYLVKAGYKVFEVSEDYAVWIKDYSRSEKPDGSVTISITVKITKPTSIYEKAALAEKRVHFIYTAGQAEAISTDESFARFLRKKIVRTSRQVELEAETGGKLVRDTVEELLKEIGK